MPMNFKPVETTDSILQFDLGSVEIAGRVN